MRCSPQCQIEHLIRCPQFHRSSCAVHIPSSILSSQNISFCMRSVTLALTGYMPRLSHSLLRRAWNIDPLLPLLLRPCRDLHSARNELMWLREHVDTRLLLSRTTQRSRYSILHSLCQRRAHGEPLQYIIGTQPFGNLEILCRRGVLIPRPETEAWVIHLAKQLRGLAQGPLGGSLRVLDLCTGTGCISLLLHSLLAEAVPKLRIQGVDNAPEALELAQDNLEKAVADGTLAQAALEQVSFKAADVLNDRIEDILDDGNGNQEWNVIVSNPPYISESGFKQDTERSVRNFEPRAALVPPQPAQSRSPDGKLQGEDDISGDAFYERIFMLATRAHVDVLAAEVGGKAQAHRVMTMVVDKSTPMQWREARIWRDRIWERTGFSSPLFGRRKQPVKVVGAGHERAIVLVA